MKPAQTRAAESNQVQWEEAARSRLQKRQANFLQQKQQKQQQQQQQQQQQHKPREQLSPQQGEHPAREVATGMRMKRKTADVLSPKQTVDIATLLISQAKTSKKEGLAKV